MADPSSLVAWLAAQSPQRRARLVRVAGLPAGYAAEPAQVAARLSSFPRVVDALHEVDAWAGALLELLLLGGRSTAREEVDAEVGDRASREQVDAGLERLEELALAWRYGAAAEQRVRPQGMLRELLGLPLGLGLPAADLLGQAAPYLLDPVAVTLGVPSAPVGTLPARLAAVLADPPRVRALLDAAPPAARQALRRLVTPGARVGWGHYPPPAEDDPQFGWLRLHGLVVVRRDLRGEVPREVAVAVRGGRLLTVEPVPPPLGAPVEGALVRREGAHAAAGLLADARLLLARITAAAAPLRKDGSLGVRELRRLAKEAALPERRTRLVVELLAGADCLSRDGADLRISSDGQQWLEAEPSEQWTWLLAAWLDSGRALLPRDTSAAALPTGWDPGEPRPLAPVALLRGLREAGPDMATDPERLVAWLAWARPYVPRSEDLVVAAATLLDEASALGVVAVGALTAPGRAAAEADLPAARSAVAEGLPAPLATVVLQADLTATVTGPPAARLSRLLDASADRESSGHATTWRFTSGSVRRWLDAGHTAEELLAALDGVAERGVPDVLGALVRDAERRHGELTVHPVASVVVARDPATAAQAVRERRLASLGLVELAPGVLGATAPVQEVLAALRSVGLFPAAAGDASARQEVSAELAREVASATLVSRREVTVLVKAARGGLPVRVSHGDGSGASTTRVLEQVRLEPPYLSGVDAAAGGRRRLRLDSVFTVRAVQA